MVQTYHIKLDCIVWKNYFFSLSNFVESTIYKQKLFGKDFKANWISHFDSKAYTIPATPFEVSRLEIGLISTFIHSRSNYEPLIKPLNSWSIDFFISFRNRHNNNKKKKKQFFFSSISISSQLMTWTICYLINLVAKYIER